MNTENTPLPLDVPTLLRDPATSFWLKQAIKDNLERDPVDALGDAEVLVVVLQNHLQGALG